MKKIVLLLLVSICACYSALAQDITQYQYWYDNDYSTSVIEAVTPNTLLDLNTALTGASSLSGGTHSVNFRAKDSNGKWSTTLKEQFYNLSNSTIVSYEYWFDNDYSSKITNAVAPTQSYILASSFNTSAVGYGVHTLNFRAKDFSGKWSVVMKEYIYKSVAGSEFSTAEYWIDNDFANKQSISFTSSDLVFINQNLLTTNLDDKLHTFNFRMQDQGGKWSVVTSSHFMVNSLIVGYEYWFDTNYSNKTTINVTPTSLLQNQPDFVATGLTGGLHVVNFRAKNNFGKYSTAISQNITVIVTPAFMQVAPVCIGSVMSPLPTTSTNNITGTWSPALNNLATTEYTFTPNAGQFAVPTTMTIVAYIDTPTFNAIAPVGIGSSIAALPTTSLNGYTGTWSPALDNMVTTTYTFTPDSGQCATTTTLEIVVNPNLTFYADADGDGYGNPLISQLSVSQPIGFVLNDDDCNDLLATINPNVSEIAYDGIDNNCDGNLDEGFPQLTSKVVASQCGTSIAAMNSLVLLDIVPNATKYKVKVTNTANNTFETIETPNRYFRISNLASYDFATTYAIQVEVQRSGIWLGYFGATCQIISPNLPVLALTGAACGMTVSNRFTGVATPNISGVTSYKFRITRNIPDAIPQEYVSNWNGFLFHYLGGFIYGSSYTVEVAVNTPGDAVFSAYGSPCTVNTPIVPTLSPTSCDAIVTGPYFGIYTTNLTNNVTGYQFEITSVAGIVILNTTLNWFYPTAIPGYVAGRTYQIRVALKNGTEYSDYGDSCTLNPGSAERPVVASKMKETEFKVTGYPNPFESSFSLNISSTSSEKITIEVFDMIGKRLQSQTINTSEINELPIGAKYPAGVYNVVVSQSTDVKSLRMIKR